MSLGIVVEILGWNYSFSLSTGTDSILSFNGSCGVGWCSVTDKGGYYVYWVRSSGGDAAGVADFGGKSSFMLTTTG